MWEVVRARRLQLQGLLAGAVSAFLVFAGGAALKWYFWDVVVRQADEPDRSMLFWGLPVVFIGVGALGGGALLAMIAFRQLARHRSASGSEGPATPG